MILAESFRSLVDLLVNLFLKKRRKPQLPMVQEDPESAERTVRLRMHNLVSNLEFAPADAGRIADRLSEYTLESLHANPHDDPREIASATWQRFGRIFGDESLSMSVFQRAIECRTFGDYDRLSMAVFMSGLRRRLGPRNARSRDHVSEYTIACNALIVIGKIDFLIQDGVVRGQVAWLCDPELILRALWLDENPAGHDNSATVRALHVAYGAGRDSIPDEQMLAFVRMPELGYRALPKLEALFDAGVMTPAVMDVFLEMPMSFTLFKAGQLVEQLQGAHAGGQADALRDMLMAHAPIASPEDDVSAES